MIWCFLYLYDFLWKLSQTNFLSSIICGWNSTTSLGPAYAHVNFLSNFTQRMKKNSLLVPVGKLHKYKNRVRTALTMFGRKKIVLLQPLSTDTTPTILISILLPLIWSEVSHGGKSWLSSRQISCGCNNVSDSVWALRVVTSKILSGGFFNLHFPNMFTYTVNMFCWLVQINRIRLLEWCASFFLRVFSLETLWSLKGLRLFFVLFLNAYCMNVFSSTYEAG